MNLWLKYVSLSLLSLNKLIYPTMSDDGPKTRTRGKRPVVDEPKVVKK